MKKTKNRIQGSLVGSQNRKIPISSWIPSKTKTQLLIVHGFSEHMGYYYSVAEELCEHNIAVHIMDLPGHGLAEGIRGHIDDFQEYIDNLNLLFEENPNFLKTKPTFLLGHSLGALIAAHYCLQGGYRIKGLALTSPLTGFPLPGSVYIKLLALYCARNHRNQPYPKPAGVKSLSRNHEMWDTYYRDPLRVRTITPNLYLTMAARCQLLQKKASSMKIPLLMFLSKKDSVISVDSAHRFFEQAGSVDKTLVVFSQAMHELFQEQEKDQVIDKLLSWMKDRN
ncbi:lysophospholipase [bacterium]|nr:lysophospholipase [bacterium]